MIGFKPAEKAPFDHFAPPQSHRGILDHGHGVLVLSPNDAQPFGQPHGHLSCAGGKSVKLKRIACESHPFTQGADNTPGMPTGHGEILARSENNASLRMR